MVRAIVGANWGDEGKGKITDMFAEKSDIVIRFQGGANAGHTIINEHGRFALHLMPSGTIHTLRSVSVSGCATAAPAGDTCLKLAALARPVASLSSFTSCQELNASSKFI